MRIRNLNSHLAVLVSLSLAILFSTFGAYGQAESPAPFEPKPISAVLNPDGTVKPGVSGSFDPKGFRMVPGPKGQPKFVQKENAQNMGAPAGCTDAWDSRFAQPGVAVSAAATDGSGNVYVGGTFLSIGGVAANQIAKWDGTSWTALGSGVTGTSTANIGVTSIAISGTDVFVGGYFTTAGGSSANAVAKWNGTAWSSLGTGLSGPGGAGVVALAVSGQNVYVAGLFSTAGAVPANNIAKWDGSTWSALGSGISGLILSLAASGSDVYAGGQFAAAGGVPANRIAKWDGNTWSALGTGINGAVNAIVISGSQVYAAGDFFNAGGTGVGNIAKWNGTAWSALGDGLNGIIQGLTVSGSDIYASGEFTASGTSSMNRIARWNGTSWSKFGGGSEVPVDAVGVVGNSILASGTFSDGFGARFTGVGKWDGSSWSLAGFGSGAGLNGRTRAIVPSGSDIYVGGDFPFAGDVPVKRIAKWNGTSWSALPQIPGIFPNEVRAIAISGTDVYVAARDSGSTSQSGIAKWNGSSWTILANPVTGIEALHVVGTDLYAAGQFSAIQGVTARNIAKWNGTSWSGLNTGTMDNAIVRIASIGSDIYAAGYFTTIGGINANRIAKWNGSAWSALGSGLDDAVNDMMVQGTDIYVVGNFVMAGGNPANRIAKWNGTSWSTFGNGLNDRVFAIAISGSNVYVGGDFLQADGVNAPYLARWNGTSWSGVAGGAENEVYSLAVSGNDLYVGGAFYALGCQPSRFFGRLIGERWAPSAGQDWHTAANWASGSVPAATANISITSGNVSVTTADAAVHDMMISNGRTVTVASGRTLTVNGNLNIGDGHIDGDGTVVITNCDPRAIYGGSLGGFIRTAVTRCVGGSGTFNFPVGTGGDYAPVDLSSILGSGQFTVRPRSGPYSSAAAGLPANRLQRYWETANSGVARADITFAYKQSDIMGQENGYFAFGIDAGIARRMDTHRNEGSNRVRAWGVTSFAPVWTLAEVGFVYGKALTASGRPAVGVHVTLSDGVNPPQFRVTDSTGLYRFFDIDTHRAYTLTVASQRYVFASPSVSIPVGGNMANINFVASAP